MHHPDTTISTGVIGTAASLGSAFVSILPHVETWLRISSLCIGLVIGILTLDKIIKERRKKK